MFNFLTGDRL